MDEFIFEIEDYRGVKVKLARTVWQDKILSTLPIGHPEVKPYMNIIPQAIHLPDVVFQSTRRKNTHIFYKLRVDKKGHHIARVERTRNKPSILANIAVASHPGRL